MQVGARLTGAGVACPAGDLIGEDWVVGFRGARIGAVELFVGNSESWDRVAFRFLFRWCKFKNSHW